MRRPDPMRTLLVFTCLLAFAAAPALAHNPHDPCYSSRSLNVGFLLHVDSYNRPCIGVIVTTPIAACMDNDPHVYHEVHTPILHGNGCETGVVVYLPPSLP